MSLIERAALLLSSVLICRLRPPNHAIIQLNPWYGTIDMMCDARSTLLYTLYHGMFCVCVTLLRMKKETRTTSGDNVGKRAWR